MQGRQRIMLPCTCRSLRSGSSGHGNIGAPVAECLLQAWLLGDAQPMWRGLGPGKTHFPPLSSWKEDQGDLVTARRFWACGQPHFPSISQTAQEMYAICGSPLSQAHSLPSMRHQGRPTFLS